MEQKKRLILNNMKEIQSINEIEARRYLDLANQAQVVMGQLSDQYKDRLLAVAGYLTESDIANLRTVLSNTGQNQESVIGGWLNNLETVSEDDQEMRNRLGKK